jgi:FAD binding domain
MREEGGARPALATALLEPGSQPLCADHRESRAIREGPLTDSHDRSEKVSKDPDSDHTSTGRPVLVVGAGPTGLPLAAELQRREVSFQLIDARSAPLHWDRATVVHPRSLELFESLGLIKRFLDAWTRQRGVTIHSGGQVLGTMDLSTCGSIYGFNLGMSGEVTESILTEYLHQQDGEVIRSSRLVGLTPQASWPTSSAGPPLPSECALGCGLRSIAPCAISAASVQRPRHCQTMGRLRCHATRLGEQVRRQLRLSTNSQ